MKTNEQVHALTRGDFSVGSTNVLLGDAAGEQRKRARHSLDEAIAFWFAVSSPLTGVLIGLLGAWLVTWLTT